MKLHDFVKANRGVGVKLSAFLGVVPAQLHNLCKGLRPVAPHLAIKIEQFTRGQVTRADMVPDWQAIWPEFDPAHSPYAPLAADASMAQKIERAAALTGLSVLTTSLAAAYGSWHTQHMAKPIAMKYAGEVFRFTPKQYAHGAVN